MKRAWVGPTSLPATEAAAMSLDENALVFPDKRYFSNARRRAPRHILQKYQEKISK
jgi:hypothetical protein